MPKNYELMMAIRDELTSDANENLSEDILEVIVAIAKQLFREQVKRRTDDGELAECPLCGSLDIGGAHDTVNCYGPDCGLQITRPAPLQNAIDAWNMRAGKPL